MEPVLVTRCDNVSLRELKLTPEGYLQTRGVFAKEGILTYYNADGQPFREFVPADTLRDPEHLATVPGLPTTNRHPLEAEVRSDNAAQVMRGFTEPPTEVKTDGEDTVLEGGVKILDAATVADIQAGMSELSLGYKAHLRMTPGTWRGQRYDAVQVKRINNHLAVVPAARAGHKARLRLDSAHNLIKEDDVDLVTIKIDGKDVQVPKEIAPAIESALKVSAAIRKDADDKGTGAAAELQRKLDETQAQLEVLKKAKEEDESEEKKKEDAKRVNDMVRERVSLMDAAKGILPAAEHAKLDGLDAVGIMRLVVEKAGSGLKLDGKSEDYVRAAYDQLVAVHKDGKKKDSTQRSDSQGLGALIVHGPNGAQRTDGEGKGVVIRTINDARAHQRQALKNLHKQPLSAA
jgi:uncharacterized protein